MAMCKLSQDIYLFIYYIDPSYHPLQYVVLFTGHPVCQISTTTNASKELDTFVVETYLFIVLALYFISSMMWYFPECVCLLLSYCWAKASSHTLIATLAQDGLR